MKVYLDMCALKRPFDDQRQGRILIETAAVMRILDAAAQRTLTLCNSVALTAENRRNPNQRRRAREILLGWIGKPAPATPFVFDRAEEFVRHGVQSMDALHLAFAESLRADWFVTVDDRLLSRAAGLKLGVPVRDVIEFVREQEL